MWGQFNGRILPSMLGGPGLIPGTASNNKFMSVNCLESISDQYA